MFLLEDIFGAYYDCRRNKRNTLGALEFELHYETECIRLFDDIIYKRYMLLPNTAFIVRDPVQREILASHFRDRIIHHLIANRLEPHLEKLLIHDVYSSRKEKWTHYGIKRIEKFMRSVSDNYQRDAYVLKLDISGFFMGINRELLFQKIQTIIRRYIPPDEQDILLYLLNIVIFTDIKKNIRIKWNKTDWVWLPKSKSLFYAKHWCGLPIWNLTSQIFSNIYMNEFDVFIKKTLKIQYYGRYVDDFILIHQDKEYLKSCLPRIRQYLIENLWLTLHPKKIYLQPIQNGVLFLGTYIKPWRKYVGRRTKWNFYECINVINKRLQNIDPLSDTEKNRILAQMNSYLWFCRHSNSYLLRSKMIWFLQPSFWDYFDVDISFIKITIKPNPQKHIKK